MRFGFELTEHAGQEGDRVTIYTFRKFGCELTEIEKFWRKEAVQTAPDHDSLKLRLYQDILKEHNFSHYKCHQGSDRWFRDESDATDPDGINAEALCASIPAKDKKDLPKPYPRLRLYCFRMRRILIAGNGGVKKDQRIQDDPVLTTAWKDVRYVMKRVHKRIEWTHDLNFEEYTTQSGHVEEDPFILEGDHDFDPLDSL